MILDKRYPKWIHQRITRGFDDRETWSLDCTIARFVAPRLDVLRDTSVGYPPDLESQEAWTAVIDKMSQAMYLVADQFRREIDGNTQEYIDEGLELFSFFFQALWS